MSEELLQRGLSKSNPTAKVGKWDYFNIGATSIKALKAAKINVVANAGDPSSGITSVMDMFSSKGGTAMGTMLQGLANTPEGKKVVDKLLGDDDKK